MHRIFPFLLLLLAGCAGNNFDEATLPPEQLATEMAFTRLSQHGEMEPVLDVGQQLVDWQFFVASTTTSSLTGSEKKTVYTLKDRSGIGYTVASASTPPPVIDQMHIGEYGYGTGEIISVDRDLAAGEIDVMVKLRSWRKR